MGVRNNIFGLFFLMGVLAFTVFAAKRLLFRPSPATSGVGALLDRAKPPAKPAEPKPSAAVPATPNSEPSSSALSPAVPAPTSSGQAQVPTPEAGGAAANAKQEQSPAAGATTATEDHHPEDYRPLLRFESGTRLWIRVTAISREPDGSFTFHGTLLQPVELANANRLDQGTELAGSGTVTNGHVAVLIRTFTAGGANYALQNASASNKRPGTGLAVELNPGKLLEVWLASPSVYRKTP